MSLKFIRANIVIEKAVISRPTLYREIKAGRFPRQHKICRNISVWLESEVDDWIRQRSGNSETSEPSRTDI